jgi:membrane-bound ClpP family serine protease
MAKQNNTKQRDESRMPLSRKNYILILVGFAAIIVGFALMTGGGSSDPNVFNYDMFSWRRTTLAPIVVIAGFAFEIYAIMKKDKKKKQ